MDKCAEDDNRTHGHEDHSSTTRQDGNMQITLAVLITCHQCADCIIGLKFHTKMQYSADCELVIMY